MQISPGSVLTLGERRVRYTTARRADNVADVMRTNPLASARAIMAVG